MEKILTQNLRNVCLLGHSGGGKTTLTEAMLYTTKMTDRFGKVTDGNTVCDYDPEEIKRKLSISASFAPIMWNDCKINIMDTPGYFDFEGEVCQCIRVADCALIVVDGKDGIEVGTELSWNRATDNNLPKAFYINRIDDPEADFSKVIDAMRDQYGTSVCPVMIPMIEGGTVTGMINLAKMKSFVFQANGEYTESGIPAAFDADVRKYRNMLLEAVAETDETLMEKFFAEEEITRDEIHAALRAGFIDGSVVPVYAGSATKIIGVRNLMNAIAEYFPSPLTLGNQAGIDADGKEISVAIDPESTDTSLFFFKTIADPFVGKMSFFKVMTGELRKDMILKNQTNGNSEKLNKIYMMCGKKQIEAEELSCGDIGVTAKLVSTNTNDTLTTGASDIKYKPIVYPNAYMTMCVTPKAKGDEDKISLGINRLLEEDLTLKYENNAETKQLLLSGLGDTHLDVVVSKLKSRFGTSVELTVPKIAYCETIKKKVDAEGKHKKQSGGSGQYGHVKVTFSPGEAEGLTFTESVFGGTVPKNFYPAVEKGILEAMQKGVLAGFPVVHLAANLFDGSYHPVDSNEISFKLAAILAYKDGLPKANPVILEPIGELRVYVPDSYVGDVMGDLNKRRGRVLGIEPTEHTGYQCVVAEVPKAEMADYVIALRAATQGRGKFDYSFVRYEEVPALVSQKIIADAAKAETEEK